MTDRLLADGLVALHFAFIVFVLCGGLLVFRHRAWLALHLPAVAWAAYVEFTATICPLTPWENALRLRAGEAGYDGGFIEHYLVPVIYPAGLTPRMQLLLGAFVVALNVVIYARAFRRRTDSAQAGC
jgi:Protein of Unknown function (DUF2784)